MCRRQQICSALSFLVMGLCLVPAYGAESLEAKLLPLLRALNETLKPSPDLNVDGEFGPITRAAVIEWRKTQKQPETGEIDAACWKLLGVESR
jgi:peptidoglycan hydrolase-like protein with peptidoglycan-binding domain